MIASPFDRSGLASIDDLETSEWKSLFNELEEAQHVFAQKFDAYRSPEYPYKRNPLYDFSRCWEYPYVYHHLTQLFQGPDCPLVVDHGCGVTFLPFYLMQKEFNVIGVDIDAVTEKDFLKACEILPNINGKGRFQKAIDDVLPLSDNSIDALYSISVLEHIPSPEKTVADIARVLKPKGIFILTMDIDIAGNLDLSPGKFKSIINEMNAHFRIIQPETTVHPRSLITTINSPYPFTIHQNIFKKSIRPLWEMLKPLIGKPRAVFPIVAIGGYVLEKK